jgi:GNAT superfamily N-acetyltransferase
MEETLQIAFVEKPEEAAWGIIGRGVHEYNIEKTGDEAFERLCFVVQTAEGDIVGGVIGELFWGWLHVDLLWVQDDLRGQGYGHRLMVQIEDEARRRGAVGAYLDTFSFQAPEFYLRRGYELFGQLVEFPPGHQRMFLRKAF